MIAKFLISGIVISTFQVINIFSQDVNFYSKTSTFNPLVVIQCDDASFLQMKDSIELNINKLISSFLLINSARLSNFTIRDTVNYFLNTQNLNLYRIFLVVVGKEQLLQRQADFYDAIYAGRCYIPTAETSKNDRNFQVIPFPELNFCKLTNQFIRQQLWETDLNNIKDMTIKEYRNTKTSFELGFGYSKILPNGFHTLNEIPSNMSVLQIQINKTLNKNYKLMGEIGFGMNMPSKGNMSMENNSVGEDDELIGSSLMTWSVNIARYLKPKDALYPFVAIGISKSTLMLMYSDKNNTKMVNSEMYSYGSISLITGAEFRFSERVNLDVKVSYHISLNTGAMINNFNASAGININLQKKVKYYYQYLRLK